MTIALELPQTMDLLDPTAKLSSGFIKSLPIPIGLWCPSKLRNAAVDFNPLKKNFGALNGGITTVPGGFGTLSQSWSLNGASQYGQISDSPTVNVGTSDFSLIVGLQSSGGQTSATLVDKRVGSGAFTGYSFYLNGGVPAFQLNDSATHNYSPAGPNVRDGNPHLLVLAVSRSGNTGKIYLDGSLNTSTSIAATTGSLTNTNVFRFGANVNGNANSFLTGNLFIAALVMAELKAAQVSSLYSCLLTGKPFPLFEPDTLYIDEPQTSTTLNLTSKSFVFSNSNSQASIQRNINTQSDSLSDSQGNITFTRDLKSTLESRSFSSSATSVLRPLASELISQSKSDAAETRQILSSSIIISQSFSNGKFALSAFINLESTTFAESFSYVEINLSKALNSTGFALSDLLAEISIKRNLSSIGLSLSDSISQETILRPLDSESISQAKDHAEISIERLLTSEILSLTKSSGQFTTQLYTKFEVLSYRRYSSQYFVQSGSVNDSGQ